MSISKAGKTGPTAGLIDYLVRELDAKIIGGNLPLTKRAILAQSAAWNRLRPDLQSNTVHLIESYALGEEVSDAIAVKRAEEKLKRLELKNVPFLVIRHTDKDHYQHVHILASRIRLDGSVFDDSNLALRSIVITKELDAEFGMRETPFYFRAKRTRRQEYEMMRRTGANSNNKMLCERIDWAAEQSGGSFEIFLLNLDRKEVGFRLYLNDTRTSIRGISFDCRHTNHQGIGGRKLGDGYKFTELSERIGYDKRKDFSNLLEKYALVNESALPGANKKPRKKVSTDVFVLVSRSMINSFDHDEKSEELLENFLGEQTFYSNGFQASTITKISRTETEMQEAAETKTKDSQNENSKTNWSLLNDSFEGNQTDADVTNKVQKIAAGEIKNMTVGEIAETNLIEIESSKLAGISDANDATRSGNFRAATKQPETFVFDADSSQKIDEKNSSVKVGDSSEIREKINNKTATDETDSTPSAKFLKILQNEIDRARESSTHFSEFLTELQLREIICLPENDAAGKTVDLIFIKQGIDVSSGELEENYHFPALVEKLDYQDRSNFISTSSLPFDDDAFRAETIALRDKPLSEYWWKMKAETDEGGRVKINPAAFELLRSVYQHTFQRDIEDVKNIENLFDKPTDTDRFLESLDLIENNNVVYKESIASISKSIREGRQTLGNDNLILTAGEASKPPTQNLNLDLLSKKFQEALGEKSQNIIESQSEEDKSKPANNRTETAHQLGRELAAELSFKAAFHNQNEFAENIDDARFEIIVDIGKGKETREISRADLRRECLAIAQGKLADTKKEGFLRGIAEDERISIEEAEQKQFKREISKAQKFQMPWINALEKRLTSESQNLSEKTKQANLHFQHEKSRTALMAERDSAENIKEIKLHLEPETIWLEQTRAAARGDAEAFIMLETLHRANDLPRPNAVYARLLAQEAVLQMRVRANEKIALEHFQIGEEKNKIVVNLRCQNGELKVEKWSVQRNDIKPLSEGESPDKIHRQTKQTPHSIKSSDESEERFHLKTLAEINLFEIENSRSNQSSQKPHSDPVKIIESDIKLQIVRTVADYVERENKSAELARLVADAEAISEISKSGSSAIADDSRIALLNAMEDSIKREETVRDYLKSDGSLNAESLAIPESNFKDDELKEIGLTAIKIGNAKETAEYLKLVRDDAEFAAVTGATTERLAADFVIAEARAFQQANEAIRDVKPIAENIVQIELSSAYLIQSIEYLQTADSFRQNLPSVSEKTDIKNFSLEDINRLQPLLASNNLLTEMLNDQAYEIGHDLSRNIQPPLTQSEREIVEQWTFKQDFHDQVEQINRSNRFYDEMHQQAESATQNQIPFQTVAQNFTTINPSDRQSAEEAQFWKNDRRQREDEITCENAQRRLTLTEAEKAAEDADALAQINKDESTEEQEREGNAITL